MGAVEDLIPDVLDKLPTDSNWTTTATLVVVVVAVVIREIITYLRSRRSEKDTAAEIILTGADRASLTTIERDLASTRADIAVLREHQREIAADVKDVRDKTNILVDRAKKG